MDVLTQGVTLEDAFSTFLIAYAQHCESLNISQQEIDVRACREGDFTFKVESISLEGVFDCYAEYASMGNKFRVYDNAFIIKGDIPDTALRSWSRRASSGTTIFHLLDIFPSNILCRSRSSCTPRRQRP